MSALTLAYWEQWPGTRIWDGPRGRDAYGDYWAYAAPTLALVCAHTRGWQRILHAGGHIGLMSCALATCFAEVLTYEPAADNYAWLCANTAQEPRITATYGALGDGQPVGLQRGKYSPCHYAKGPGDIPCWQLDRLSLPALDVLLLDLEGGELVALQHGARLVQRCQPLIVVEEYVRWMKRYARQPGDVAALLATWNYQCVGATTYDLAFAPRAWRSVPQAAAPGPEVPCHVPC